MKKKRGTIERREILMGFAGAGALAGIGAWALGSSVRATNENKSDAQRRAALIDDLLPADEKTSLRIAADPLAAGLDPERVLDAAFLMPMWSEGPGGDVHPMAAVPAISRLLRTVTAEGHARLVPVLWAVSEAHAWSGKRRRTPELPKASNVDALLAGCARPRNDPHVPIWAAQAMRRLDRLAEHRALILGSVAAYAAFHPPTGDSEMVRIDDASDTSAEEVARAAREGTPLTATSSRALFEGLARVCTETRLADPSQTGPGVHHTTLLDALWRLHERGVPAGPTAMAWIRRLRGDHRLAEPPETLAPTGEDPFALAANDQVAAYRAALTVAARDEARFRARIAERVLTHGKNAHDFKYWDAATAIADRLEGEARTRWLAGLIAADVVRSDERWARYDEALGLVSGARG